jgi:hypothetical protein
VVWHFENVRMKLSNTYNITSYPNLEILLGELSLEISFSCDPKKVDESIAAVIKDVNNVVIGNIDKDILNKAKKACQKYEKLQCKKMKQLQDIMQIGLLYITNHLDL